MICNTLSSEISQHLGQHVTHDTVSRSDFQNRFPVSRLLIRKQIIFGTQNIQSVSYTHLDVYKRQKLRVERSTEALTFSIWFTFQ